MDLTSLHLRPALTRAGFYHAHVIVDVYSRIRCECQGVRRGDNADLSQKRARRCPSENMELRRTACRIQTMARGMKAAPTMALPEKNGIIFSHSRPRRRQHDNPYSEPFFHADPQRDCLRILETALHWRVDEAEQWICKSLWNITTRHHRHRVRHPNRLHLTALPLRKM